MLKISILFLNLDIISGAPTILPGLEVVEVNIDRDATLYCKTTGYPTPKIRWSRGEDELNTATTKHNLLPDGSLVIRG